MASMNRAKNRVVVTGLGWTIPLGSDIESAWRRMLSGESGVRATTRYDASTFPTKFGAYSTPSYEDSITASPNRVLRFSLNAVQTAWQMSGLNVGHTVIADDLGVYFAAGESCLPLELVAPHMSAAWNAQSNSLDYGQWAKIADHLSREQIVQLSPQHTLQAVARAVGAQGYVSNCMTACAASLQAIGEATELIRLGDASVMIAGGANSMLHPVGMSSFNRLGTLSKRNESPTQASRPFDASRDGFVLGEGAGAVVLESLEHAIDRGAEILAEVIGYGSTSDAYRVTDQHPESDGLVRAMHIALADAAVSANDIDYLNAHGTSTSENDRQETMAIKRVFGEHAAQLPISSIKSMIGHLLTAAGVVEFIATVLAIRDQHLPPTINLSQPDPDCDLNYIPNTSITHAAQIAMTLNTGFGGLNDAVVIRQWNES